MKNEKWFMIRILEWTAIVCAYVCILYMTALAVGIRNDTAAWVWMYTTGIGTIIMTLAHMVMKSY